MLQQFVSEDVGASEAQYGCVYCERAVGRDFYYDYALCIHSPIHVVRNAQSSSNHYKLHFGTIWSMRLLNNL